MGKRIEEKRRKKEKNNKKGKIKIKKLQTDRIKGDKKERMENGRNKKKADEKILNEIHEKFTGSDLCWRRRELTVV